MTPLETTLVVVVFLLALALCWVVLGPKIRRTWAKIKVQRALARVRRQQQALVGKNLTEVDIHDPKSSTAMMIDTKNPPTRKIYRNNSGRPAPSCTCHNIPLKDGDVVILWPIPGHPEGAMDIICHLSLQEAKDD